MGFIIPRTQTNGDYWDLMGYHGIANNRVALACPSPTFGGDNG